MQFYVALIAAALLSSSSAFLPEEAQAEVLSLIEPKIVGLLSLPGISRAGGGIRCYDKYLPLITAAAENSKSDTQACIAVAKTGREDESNKVKQERETLDDQIHNVQNTLNSCLIKTNELEYLNCLKDNSVNMQSVIDRVGKKSISLSESLTSSYRRIDAKEDLCLKSAIEKSKTVSSELLAALQNCLMNGLGGGESEGSSEGGTGDGSEGGSEGGSDGNSNGGSDEGSSESNNGSGGESEGDLDGSGSGSDGSVDEGSEGGLDEGFDGSSDISNNGSDGGLDGDLNEESGGVTYGSTDGDVDEGTNSGSDDGLDGKSGGGSNSVPKGSPDEGLNGSAHGGLDGGSNGGLS